MEIFTIVILLLPLVFAIRAIANGHKTKVNTEMMRRMNLKYGTSIAISSTILQIFGIIVVVIYVIIIGLIMFLTM